MKGANVRVFRDKIVNELVCNDDDNANTSWTKMSNCIKRAGRVSFGESKGSAPVGKEGWWLSEDVQIVVQAKRQK